VRFAYEWHDDSGNWFRSYGNENWEFDAAGLMQRRFTCINDLPIKESDRNSTGRSAGGRMIIPASPTLVSEGRCQL
jgi:nuclear transport factor 2 (NTF2) superfamily protein